MELIHHYIDLSWAVVGICERPRVGDQRSGMNARQPLLVHIPGIDNDEAAAVEHYVIGYMAFWHIAFVDEDCLVPCNDDALRNDARQKIDRYIADHPPVETFPASTSSSSASITSWLLRKKRGCCSSFSSCNI